MKLDKLWISGYKNLRDFSVDFDEKSPVTVLVGWNGTGKSNLFEALVTIFRDLREQKTTSFEYRIQYLCHGNRILIDSDPKRTGRDQVRRKTAPISGESIKQNANDNAEYLPNYIFCYYSGPNPRIKQLFTDSARRYYREVVDLERTKRFTDEELRSTQYLFFAETHHSKYVLLAFFMKLDTKTSAFLEKYFRIVGFESVLFTLKKPSWARVKLDHFWGAKGLVREFMDRLFEVSLAPLKQTRKIQETVRRSRTEEFYYLYIKDIGALTDLASDFDSPNSFFARLESTDISEVIHDVSIRVKIRRYDGTLTFRELSEGEQQLLMVLGLLRFTKSKESLILLDEPDTHLNPFWSAEYLDILRDIVDDETNMKSPELETRHIIMSSHDPLVIAGLEREQVQVMKRAETDDKCFAEIPARSPRGMGFEGILTSDMFGFRSALDRPTRELLDRKRRLAIKEKRTPAEDKELTELNLQVGDLDFTNVVRDEYFKLFANSMAEFEEKSNISGLILTPEQVKARKDFAREIAERLVRQKKELRR